MLAILLVGLLLLIAVASLGITDLQTRNLLLGGVVATSGSAVAFYFASRDADTARRDILSASVDARSVEVPNFKDMTVVLARELAKQRGLDVVMNPQKDNNPPIKENWVVVSQDVRAGVVVERLSTITLEVKAPSTVGST